VGSGAGRLTFEASDPGRCFRRIDGKDAAGLKSMKPYLAVITMDLKLALRLRAVIFFNSLFPLIFFFTFATVLKGNSNDMAFVVTMSVTLGVLGSGFFGAGIRAIQERELGILRRYKVTPITPAPLLVGS